MRVRLRPVSYLVVAGLLVAANLLNNELAPQAYLPVCVIATAALITVARLAGCTWADLGFDRGRARHGLLWGLVVVAVVLAAYGVALALPALRDVLADRRVTALGLGEVLFKAFVWVPFGTVLLEETAFRGVVYGLVQKAHGPGVATAASSLVFGLWHLLPARGIATANPVLAASLGASPGGRALAYALAVAGTALAGVVLCELRRRSGSILAPMVAHWAANGLGYLGAHLSR
jgi:membrane protease YdiL (CAAX protease family)